LPGSYGLSRGRALEHNTDPVGTDHGVPHRADDPLKAPATTWVLIESAIGNYRVAIEPGSESEALLALCRELGPALSSAP
jgi:hypothetical protein